MCSGPLAQLTPRQQVTKVTGKKAGLLLKSDGEMHGNINVWGECRAVSWYMCRLGPSDGAGCRRMITEMLEFCVDCMAVHMCVQGLIPVHWCRQCTLRVGSNR